MTNNENIKSFFNDLLNEGSPQQRDKHSSMSKPVSTEDFNNQLLNDTILSEKEFFQLKDRYLPIANVNKIMKMALPESYAKVSKDAKELMQWCASEFINLIACRAKEFQSAEQRKSMDGDDIVEAMSSLDLKDYSSISNIYLLILRNSDDRSKSVDQNEMSSECNIK